MEHSRKLTLIKEAVLDQIKFDLVSLSIKNSKDRTKARQNCLELFKELASAGDFKAMDFKTSEIRNVDMDNVDWLMSQIDERAARED